jgi:hypothetical protein
MTSVFIITKEDFIPEYCYFTSTFSYVLAADLVGYLLPVLAVLLVNSLIFFELRKKKIKRKRVVFSNNQSMSYSYKLHSLSKEIALVELDHSTNKSSIAKYSVNRSYNLKFKEFINKETRALVCLCIVTGFLVILFSIFCVTWPYKAFCSECVSDLILEIGYWLSYVYSSFNPVLLLIFHEKFRNELRNYFRKASVHRS